MFLCSALTASAPEARALLGFRLLPPERHLPAGAPLLPGPVPVGCRDSGTVHWLLPAADTRVPRVLI